MGYVCLSVRLKENNSQSRELVAKFRMGFSHSLISTLLATLFQLFAIFNNVEELFQKKLQRLNVLLPDWCDVYKRMAHTAWTYWSINKWQSMWTLFSEATFDIKTAIRQMSSIILRICTLLWCVRSISLFFGNRRTCFLWKCNVLQYYHWYNFKRDHEEDILHILQNATNKLWFPRRGLLISMLHSSQVGRLGLIHLYNLHFIDLAQLSCFTHWWGSEVCLM